MPKIVYSDLKMTKSLYHELQMIHFSVKTELMTIHCNKDSLGCNV